MFDNQIFVRVMFNVMAFVRFGFSLKSTIIGIEEKMLVARPKDSSGHEALESFKK
jgi:hypothetical protein